MAPLGRMSVLRGARSSARGLLQQVDVVLLGLTALLVLFGIVMILAVRLGADGWLRFSRHGQPAGSAAASLQGGCRGECWLPACAAGRMQRSDPFFKTGSTNGSAAVERSI